MRPSVAVSAETVEIAEQLSSGVRLACEKATRVPIAESSSKKFTRGERERRKPAKAAGGVLC